MSYIYVDELPDASAPLKIRVGTYERGGKRLFDLAITLMVLPFAIPVIFLTWSGMKLDGGPGFYRQKRIGKNGVTFSCWKIRTMEANADQRLSDIIQGDPHLAREWETKQKLTNDPRITRFGRFLRVSSLDELPQFWNVLIGDMSLIGPRPITPEQRQIYSDAPTGQSYYYSLRPGISGLWQTRSRNIGNFSERAKFDKEYAADISFLGDIKIALKTILVVLRATGK